MNYLGTHSRLYLLLVGGEIVGTPSGLEPAHNHCSRKRKPGRDE